jgi:hypothetical protein
MPQKHGLKGPTALSLQAPVSAIDAVFNFLQHQEALFPHSLGLVELEVASALSLCSGHPEDPAPSSRM